MAKGGKIIRPDGTVANGRKKLADPKVQTTCYFLKSAIEKLGKEQCRLIAEQAVNEAVLKFKVAQKFNDDFEYYKSNLSQSLDESQVNLMLHAYCMGYCELSNHLNEEFDLNPVLEKISELNPLVSGHFKYTDQRAR